VFRFLFRTCIIRIVDVIKNPSTIPELVETIFNLIMLLRKIYSEHLQKFIESFGIEMESTGINEESNLTEQSIYEYLDLEQCEDKSDLYDSIYFRMRFDDQQEKYQEMNWKILLQQERGM